MRMIGAEWSTTTASLTYISVEGDDIEIGEGV